MHHKKASLIAKIFLIAIVIFLTSGFFTKKDQSPSLLPEYDFIYMVTDDVFYSIGESYNNIFLVYASIGGLSPAANPDIKLFRYHSKTGKSEELPLFNTEFTKRICDYYRLIYTIPSGYKILQNSQAPDGYTFESRFLIDADPFFRWVRRYSLSKDKTSIALRVPNANIIRNFLGTKYIQFGGWIIPLETKE